MACNVVAHPNQGDGLSNISSSHDAEKSKVSDANFNTVHVEQDGVSDGGNATSANDETEAVLGFVTEESGGQSTHGRKDEDRDRHNLSTDRGPSQLFENGWCEERATVAGGDNAQVHGNTRLEVSGYP